MAPAPAKVVLTSSRVRQMSPVVLDGALTTWNGKRPLYWYDWEDDWSSDARFVTHQDCLVVFWPARRLPCSKWPDQR